MWRKRKKLLICTSTSANKNKIRINVGDNISPLIPFASFSRFSVMSMWRVVITRLTWLISWATVSLCVSHHVVHAFKFWLDLGHLPLTVHFQLQLALPNCTEITSITRVKVCLVILVHDTLSENVLGNSKTREDLIYGYSDSISNYKKCYLYLYLSVYLSIHLSIYLSTYLPTYLPISNNIYTILK